MLIFNLDMGKVPIMNRDTMAKKATLALTNMAAAKEKKGTSIPSDEAIAALDDVLSVATNYQILGSGTRTYRNQKDANNSAFCTAPVKYEFKDKETRNNAEKVLRTRCGVNCAIPYPVMVRECIKQIVNEVKKDYPDNFIKVTVDTGRLVFWFLKLRGNRQKTVRIQNGSTASQKSLSPPWCLSQVSPKYRTVSKLRYRYAKIITPGKTALVRKGRCRWLLVNRLLRSLNLHGRLWGGGGAGLDVLTITGCHLYFCSPI
jgi:hypothetical protein